MDVICNLTPRWTSVNVILDVMFQKLSMKDLNSCAQVCKLWNDVVIRVKRRRKQKICWFFYSTLEYRNRSCKVAFSEFVDNLPIQPRLAIIYRTPPSLNYRKTESGDRIYHPYIESSELMECLPVSCLSYLSIADYVSCTASDCKETGSGCSKMWEALVCILFPALPGVKMYSFKLLDKGCESFKDHADIPDNEAIKFLLLLLSEKNGPSHCSRVLKKLMSNCITQRTANFALGGKLMEEVSFKQGKMPSEMCSFGIAFTGDNVSAISILVPMSEHHERVKERFKEAFDCVCKDQCIAFAFSSFCHRHTFFIPSGNGDLFQKLYPTVSLFTVFGCGGFGFPDLSNTVDLSIDLYNRIFHKYQAVFIMVSIKSDV